MLVNINGIKYYGTPVSVAGCLGYDVLDNNKAKRNASVEVSVAGCLGYDVLESTNVGATETNGFQLLVV